MSWSYEVLKMKRIQILYPRMIFSENRLPLFGIMLSDFLSHRFAEDPRRHEPQQKQHDHIGGDVLEALAQIAAGHGVDDADDQAAAPRPRHAANPAENGGGKR